MRGIGYTKVRNCVVIVWLLCGANGINQDNN